MTDPAIDAPTPGHWDKALEDFAESGTHTLWRRHSDRVNRDLIAEWFAPDSRGLLLKTDLFDEATGDGLETILRSRAQRVVGIDLSRYVVGRAVHGRQELLGIASDARTLPFEDRSFDRIVSLSTLDHFETFEEIERALAEIARVLKPGGELLLTLDNLANPLVWLRNALPLLPLHRLGIVPYFVGRSCGPRRLAKATEQTGLAVIATTAIMHTPRVLGVAAARLARTRGSATRDRFLAVLGGFEVGRRWPTRFLTGYFIAIRAVKTPGPS